MGYLAFVGLYSVDADPSALPAPPAAARPLPSTGPNEVRTDLAVAELYDRYGPVFGEMFSRSYRLPDTAEWDEILAHYSALLPDWRSDDARFPPDRLRFHSRTWIHGKRVFAVALLKAGTGDLKVLITVANGPFD